MSSATRSTSLCTFSFSDGRRCRTPRQPGHPLFCSDHARRQDRINTSDQLGREFAHFFSGRYLSACDLNTALGRLFAATVRGHVPAKTTRTLAYLAQVMVQCIHLTEHEHAESFSPDSWRREVRASFNSNSAFLSPVSVEAGLQPGPAPITRDRRSPDRPSSPPSCSAGFTPATSFNTGVPAVAGTALSEQSSAQRQAAIPGETTYSAQSPGCCPANLSSSSNKPADGSVTTSAPSDTPNVAAAFRPAQSSSAIKSQLKQLLVSERAPNSSPSSEPIKPVDSPARKQPSTRTQTGPSGLPLLAALPLHWSQKPSDSAPSITPAESTLARPPRNC